MKFLFFKSCTVEIEGRWFLVSSLTVSDRSLNRRGQLVTRESKGRWFRNIESMTFDPKSSAYGDDGVGRIRELLNRWSSMLTEADGFDVDVSSLLTKALDDCKNPSEEWLLDTIERQACSLLQYAKDKVAVNV